MLRHELLAVYATPYSIRVCEVETLRALLSKLNGVCYYFQKGSYMSRRYGHGYGGDGVGEAFWQLLRVCKGMWKSLWKRQPRGEQILVNYRLDGLYNPECDTAEHTRHQLQAPIRLPYAACHHYVWRCQRSQGARIGLRRKDNLRQSGGMLDRELSAMYKYMV